MTDEREDDIDDVIETAEVEPDGADFDLAKLPRNDTGNAERLVAREGKNLIYLDEAGWHWWGDKYWMPGPARKSPDAVLAAQRVAEAIQREAEALKMEARDFKEAMPSEPPKVKDGEDDPHAVERARYKLLCTELELKLKRIDAHHRFAIASGNSARITGMLAMAEPKLRKRPQDMDRAPFLFNTESGTLELGDPETGSGDIIEREHRRGDYITHIAGTRFDPRARDGAHVPACPEFLRFLEWAQPDPAVRDFLQRWFGYCLTADNSEQVFMMFYGSGSNGKSVLMIIMEALLGSYAATVPIEVFLHDDRRRGGDATPELVPLISARLALASEPEESTRLSEAIAKKVTGGDKINVRRLFEGMISIVPKFKVLLSFNNKPAVRGQDEGIWRRILLVPFNSFMPKDRVDKKLAHRLLATEGPAILNWALDGMRYWREIGLAPPPAVVAATSEYRAESDPVGKFLAECTERSPDGEVKATRLYEVYRRWCVVNGHHALSSTKLGLQLKNKKIEARHSNGAWYHGLGLDIAAVAELERKGLHNVSNNASNDEDAGGGDPRDGGGYGNG
jgi:putative DNA primase/helicase